MAPELSLRPRAAEVVRGARGALLAVAVAQIAAAAPVGLVLPAEVDPPPRSAKASMLAAVRRAAPPTEQQRRRAVPPKGRRRSARGPFTVSRSPPRTSGPRRP